MDLEGIVGMEVVRCCVCTLCTFMSKNSTVRSVSLFRLQRFHVLQIVILFDLWR